MMEKPLATYWDEFYAAGGVKRIPSQFAVFVLNEFSNKTIFVDCGCGNGRDSFFFAEHQKITIGLDASQVAVDLNQADAHRLKLNNLQFNQVDFSSTEQTKNFIEQHRNSLAGSVFYARFFLHAVNVDTEAIFFDFCASLMDENSVLCIEFRTEKDASLQKETAAHYRRFINMEHIQKVAAELGLTALYSIEGRGFAKHRKDDAEVARIIFRKN